MRVKTKVVKKSPAKGKSKQSDAMKSIKSEQNLRCTKWIQSQKNVKLPQVSEDTNLNTTTSEKLPSQSSDSLHLLKSLSKAATEYVLFTCEWSKCLQSFESKCNLYEHVGSHITNLFPKQDKYICSWDLCNYITNCADEITRHLHYHAYHTVLKTMGESLCLKVNLPRCTNDSQSRNTVPELSEDFICRWHNCNSTFKSAAVFYGHVQSHCTFDYDISKTPYNEKPAIHCKWNNCKKEFAIKYRLKEHIRKHTGEKLVGCSHCGALFKSNTILFDHCKRQIANNTQNFQCAQCFKYFATDKLLRIHFLVHVNCFKCSMCDMTCNSSAALATHIRFRHIKDRPFQCTKCEYRCVTKSDLTRHTLYVHNKKHFQCGEFGCNYSVKSIHLLRKHDADVHGNDPSIYACHCCEKLYKRGKDLSLHLIKKHSFQLPSGHKRFTYKIDENGFYRVETMRMESLEVTKQILFPHPVDNNSEIARSSYEIDSAEFDTHKIYFEQSEDTSSQRTDKYERNSLQNEVVITVFINEFE